MSWPPKDWRALIALLGSIAGAMALTAFVWWGCWMLMQSEWWSLATEPHRAETFRWVLWIAVGTIAVVIVGLGFAINRRSFRGKLGKDGATLDFEGGEGDELTPVRFASYSADHQERQP